MIRGDEEVGGKPFPCGVQGKFESDRCCIALAWDPFPAAPADAAPDEESACPRNPDPPRDGGAAEDEGFELVLDIVEAAGCRSGIPALRRCGSDASCENHGNSSSTSFVGALLLLLSSSSHDAEPPEGDVVLRGGVPLGDVTSVPDPSADNDATPLDVYEVEACDDADDPAPAAADAPPAPFVRSCALGMFHAFVLASKRAR